MTALLPISAATYQRSPLHADGRNWKETSCYVDLWIEGLHGLGLDPIAGLAFTLSTDFDGEQWQFLKYPLDDLAELYGIDVAETNPWRGLEFHIEEQLVLGRWLTVEVDSWYLPDTAGVSYQIEHVKTSIIPNLIDRDAKVLGYFHNSGYYELSGEDYDGALRITDGPAAWLPPYVELIRMERLARRSDDELTDIVVRQVARHLARRPATNPIVRMAERFASDLDWLREQGVAAFHRYAFATLRQCGANAELAADLCGWLDTRGHHIAAATDAFSELSSSLTSAQFSLARLAAGRNVDIVGTLNAAAPLWDSAHAALDQRFGATCS